MSGSFTAQDPHDGVTWSVDVDFLASSWTCIWDRGCLGIHDVPTPARAEGCCSLGAELLDDEEAMTVAALATTLDPERFQFADAAADGVFADRPAPSEPRHTRVVDGACIFLNRAGFDGPTGCALHLGAADAGESPTDWKPSVCWQLPLKVDRSPDGSAATLRRWTRDDWGPGGEAMAWCCTEGAASDGTTAYVGDAPVIDSLTEELTAIVGPDVVTAVRVEITRRSGGDAGQPSSSATGS